MTGQEVHQSTRAAPRFFYGYIVVVASFLILLLMLGVSGAFGVFFRPLLAEFEWTRAATSAVFSLAWIVQGSLAIVMGRLNDRFGPRLVMTLCGGIAGLGYLLVSQAQDTWQLYLFYGVMVGAGMSGAFIPLLSTVARWFVRRRSLATGIVIAGIGTGTLVVPPAANWLISTYGWRTAYLILGSLLLVIVVSLAQFLRRDPAQMGQLPYGGREGEGQGRATGVWGFSLREAVSTRQFWLTLGIFLCRGFGMVALMTHIVPHAIELGVPAATAATILATMGGMSIAGNIAMGIIADRIGNRRVIIISFILMVVALLCLVPAGEVWLLYLLVAVFGFAYGGCLSSESPLIARLFGLRSHGLIFAVIGFGFTTGAAAGPFIAGYVFDVTLSYQLAFWVCAAVAAIGFILASVLKPTRRPDIGTVRI